ncbi:c-type cytochrome [Stenoxybacter acetivorans]|uniref:c-type cytochrome n=1 Tax=Stenoxybacter acetivorans TaxID=422441 RepID=UPI00056BF4CE|nr:c-type cytochrome [Stenoxybacter acetivorans]
MKRLTLLSLVLVSGLAAAADANLANGEKIAATICVSCHAADGNSAVAMYPKLAGQDADYIIQQTHLIKDSQRTNGAAVSMMPMVSSLSDDDIRDAAAFFRAQQPKAGEANPKDNIELGAKIYRGGLADKKVPSCLSCHGPNGAGMPAGSVAKDGIIAYPRLSGQHKSYITEQLQSYQNGQRTNATMVDIAQRLNAQEIDAVANFIQGLK